MFDSPGGEIQFLHQRSIDDEIVSGRLREMMTWLEKRK